MAKKVIKLNVLDLQSIDAAISELDQNINSVNKKLDLFLQTLCEKGVEIAKARVETLGAVFTGELIESIRAEQKGEGIFVIKTDSKHAAFVEFGTGQMGEEGSYPYPFPDGVDWKYNEGKTIFEISEGQYGWFYPALDGTWKFTQGMPSRPFMYETALDLETIIQKTAEEVFKNAT